MNAVESAIAAGEGDVVFWIERPGPGGSRHSHKLRVMSIPFPEGDEIWIEVSEPGGCGCFARMTLAELAHVLINAPRSELRAIEAREVCPQGHPHHAEPF